LIFKDQENSKDVRLREKGVIQPHYSIQNIEGYYLLCCKDNKQDLNYSIIDTDDRDYCPGIINIYFIRDRKEQKIL
jgi:hypothetical protein